MSILSNSQVTSIPFKPVPFFPSFQVLGNTTVLQAFPANMGLPIPVAGVAATSNPVGIFDNRLLRATSLLLMFGATTANNVKVAFDVVGFSKINDPAAPSSALYLPCKFFLGEAQAGNINVSTPLNETTAFLCDNFSLKTFAGGNVSYIEPTDDLTAALLIIDIRGFDLVAVRLAQGAATAATKAQCWFGVN